MNKLDPDGKMGREKLREELIKQNYRKNMNGRINVTNISANINTAKSSTKIGAMNAGKSDSKIKTIEKSAKSAAKKSITPEHLKEAAGLMSEVNKTIQTANQTRQQNRAVIKQYRKEHPKSKLSDKEILENYQ